MECALYYGQDKEFKCKKETDDLTTAETNMFAKCEYQRVMDLFQKMIHDHTVLGCFTDGDLGINVSRALFAFRKQQHRMVWERRNKKSMIDGSPLEDES